MFKTIEELKTQPPEAAETGWFHSTMINTNTPTGSPDLQVPVAFTALRFCDCAAKPFTSSFVRGEQGRLQLQPIVRPGPPPSDSSGSSDGLWCLSEPVNFEGHDATASTAHQLTDDSIDCVASSPSPIVQLASFDGKFIAPSGERAEEQLTRGFFVPDAHISCFALPMEEISTFDVCTPLSRPNFLTLFAAMPMEELGIRRCHRNADPCGLNTLLARRIRSLRTNSKMRSPVDSEARGKSFGAMNEGDPSTLYRVFPATRQGAGGRRQREVQKNTASSSCADRDNPNPTGRIVELRVWGVLNSGVRRSVTADQVVPTVGSTILRLTGYDGQQQTLSRPLHPIALCSLSISSVYSITRLRVSSILAQNPAAEACRAPDAKLDFWCRGHGPYLASACIRTWQAQRTSADEADRIRRVNKLSKKNDCAARHK
ncbi:hypothetical protein DFH06DRAFT_1120563 [Mycena polygramma]|nr:hypothetical protein DFH06DRAFT_1120563 [Mycena polygramma]